MIEAKCPLCNAKFYGENYPIKFNVCFDLDGLIKASKMDNIPAITYADAVKITNGECYDNVKICIGVIDTGAPPKGEMLGIDENRIVARLDTTGEGWIDEIGHATHVASGLASEEIETPVGIIRGMCPKAEIVFVKAIGLKGGTLSTVIKAVELAVEYGAEVLNLSLGSSVGTGGDDPLSKLLDHLAVEHQIHSAVAVGNDGPFPRTVNTPATADWVQSVGAVASWGEVANFSSRGPNVRGEINPVVVAPGGAGRFGQRSEFIWGETTKESIIDVIMKEHYRGLAPIRGTSMATPLVCGALAKLKAILKDKATIQNVRISLMLSSNRPLFPIQDNNRGFGILNVKKFIEFAKAFDFSFIPLEII